VLIKQNTAAIYFSYLERWIHKTLQKHFGKTNISYYQKSAA